MVNEIDWGTILGGGSFFGLIAYLARDLIRAYFDRQKVSAEAGRSEAEREVTLSKAAMEVVDRVTDNYEMRIRAVQADAQAQIASVRADAANSVAAALHEVSTARGEASQIRAEAAQMRNTVERIEQLLLRVRATVWQPGGEDVRVEKVRTLLGDGSAPLSAFANGSTR